MDGPDRGPKRGERALPVGEQGGNGCREGRGGEPAERRRNRTGDDSDDALGLDDEIQQRRSRRSPIHSRADAPVHGRLVVVRRQDDQRQRPEWSLVQASLGNQ
jgi:hypothetical protein